MFKKMMAGFLVICIFLLLIACDEKESVNSTNSQPFEQTVNFDLSQYEKYGELSCGLIWVMKDFSDWNTEPQRKFAYFDADGRQHSMWFSSETYDPANFKDDFLILKQKSYFEKGTSRFYNCYVYDIDFREIGAFNYKNSIGTSYLTEFDSQGNAYALGYNSFINDSVIYCINSTGVNILLPPDYHSFDLGVNDLKKIKVSNEHYVVVSGTVSYNYIFTTVAYIYDKNCNLVFDIEKAMDKHIDDYAITSANVINENSVEFRFYTKSQKQFVCSMDFDGNFIKNPIEVGTTTNQGQNEIIDSNEKAIRTCSVPVFDTQTNVSEAIRVLKASGFNVVFKYEKSEKFSYGTVLHINPKSGTLLPEGSTVTLYVSIGQ